MAEPGPYRFREPVRFASADGTGVVRSVPRALGLCRAWQRAHVGSPIELQEAIGVLAVAADIGSGSAIDRAREALITYLRVSKMLQR
jgi:hypothetical protein